MGKDHAAEHCHLIIYLFIQQLTAESVVGGEI